jgi:beta-lactamase regulating signal transducer with metallopeptidase domain
MIAQLWTSTLVLALAIAAARWMPRLTARTRHAILLAGLAKFAIPSIQLPSHSAISIVVFGVPQRILKSAPPPQAQWPRMALIISIAITVLILLRQWLVHHRTLVAALAGATPATERERDALQRALRRAGVRGRVDLIRSSIAEAPAVLGVRRPVVILPAGRCDALEDDELESILLHECAHVARHDNLTGVLRAVAGAALWFHPLVWIASRDLARFAEEACDDIVAEREKTETYLSALRKVCRAAITSPAGVSCMAGANLNERMTHLMNYAALRSRALPHRLVIAAAVAIVAFCSMAGGVRAQEHEQEFRATFSIDKVGGDNYTVHGTVTEIATGRVISQPNVTLQAGNTASITTEGDPAVRLDIALDAAGNGKMRLQVSRGGKVVEVSSYAIVPSGNEPPAGDGISLNLKDADLRDVVNTFGKLTNHKVDMPDELSGKVTVSFVNTPWETALSKILEGSGLTYSIDSDTIHIRRR